MIAMKRFTLDHRCSRLGKMELLNVWPVALNAYMFLTAEQIQFVTTQLKKMRMDIDRQVVSVRKIRQYLNSCLTN